MNERSARKIVRNVKLGKKSKRCLYIQYVVISLVSTGAYAWSHGHTAKLSGGPPSKAMHKPS